MMKGDVQEPEMEKVKERRWTEAEKNTTAQEEDEKQEESPTVTSHHRHQNVKKRM